MHLMSFLKRLIPVVLTVLVMVLIAPYWLTNVLTDDPWSEAWYADRASIITPKGERGAVRAAIAFYAPNHLLTISHSARALPYEPREYTELARGEETRGKWFLYALTPHDECSMSERLP